MSVEHTTETIDWVAETLVGGPVLEGLLQNWARTSVQPTGERADELPMLTALLDVDSWLVLGGADWRVDGVEVDTLWGWVCEAVLAVWGERGVHVIPAVGKVNAGFYGCVLSTESVLRRHERRWAHQ